MEFTLEELYAKKEVRPMTVRAQEKTQKGCQITLSHSPTQTVVRL